MPTRKAVRATGVTKYSVIVVCALSVATNRAAAKTGQRSTEWSEESGTTSESDMFCRCGPAFPVSFGWLLGVTTKILAGIAGFPR